MKQIAQGLAALGRGEDKMLVHMTPKEVAGLQQLALAHGGSLTVHPQTGLPEAGFLSNILPTLAGAAAIYFGLPGVLGLSSGMTGALAGGAVGAIQNRNNPLQGAIMGGLGGYGGAGLTSAGMEAFGPQAALKVDPSLAASTSEFGGSLASTGGGTVQPPTFTEALAKQFPTTGSRVAAGLGALNATGALEQPPIPGVTPSGPSERRKYSYTPGRVNPRFGQPGEPYYLGQGYADQGTYYAAAGGGVPSADYAAGGKLLDGPGDGVSDSIPAVIQGDRPQRAALAQGEFVVPARVVAELGNGSNKAGAARLYKMMERVEASARKAKRGQDTKAYKHLPA